MKRRSDAAARPRHEPVAPDQAVAPAGWAELAAGWERWREHLDTAYRPVRARLLAELDLGPGHALLELAAGTGSAGFDALAAVDGRARHVCTDVVPAMVEAAHRRSVELGLPDAVFAVMDAEQIALATDSVDRVLCESGYMLMPDPAAALRESRRVLRSGGRLGLSVWGPAERNPWDTLAEDLLISLGHVPEPDRDAAGPRMAHEHHTRTLLHAAGFDTVHTAEVPVRFAFSDLDEWERWSIDTNTTGPALRALSPDERTAFRAHITTAFAPYRVDRGYELPGLALCVAAS